MCVSYPPIPPDLRAKAACRAPLYDLPLEIWQHIFTLSCTDGGYTAVSLALVSRFFHAASHPVRFRSLRFTSLRQIECFFTYIQNHPASHHELRPKVTHLLLAFPCAPLNDPSPELDLDNDINSASPMWYHERRLREQEKAEWDKRFTALVPSLLELVAPHLETLALLQSDAFIIPAIRPTLPRLRELTLLMGISVMLGEDDGSTLSAPSTGASGPVPSHASFAHAADRAQVAGASSAAALSHTTAASITRPATHPLGDPAVRFPALERLHLVCGRHRDWTLREPLAQLSRLAPALTHLRISNATYTHGQDECIPDFLYGALGLPRPACSDGGRRSPWRPPPSPFVQDSPEDGAADLPAMRRLNRVVVHTVSPPHGGRCERPHKEYVGLVDAVKAIAAACAYSSGGTRVELVQGERMKHKDWERSLAAQWVARIEGGSGCWEGDENDVVLGL